MKLVNNGEAFEMTYDGYAKQIPKGAFEVADSDLAHFIQTTSKKWELDVKIIDSGKAQEIIKEIVPEKVNAQTASNMPGSAPAPEVIKKPVAEVVPEKTPTPKGEGGGEKAEPEEEVIVKKPVKAKK